MSGTEILDPELNQAQDAVQVQVRHSMAVMAQWANGEKYDEKVMIERGRFAVRQTLEGKGLTVRKIETEDGKIEAYVVHGSAMAEVYVDPASGLIVETKIK